MEITDGGADRAELAIYVGGRIAAAMQQRGWVLGDGRPDVGRLQEAIGAKRWQTVQEWVLGKTVPRTHHARLVADVLGMTLEELMGAATGLEPTNAAWRAFVATPEGQSMTIEERRAVARFLPPEGRAPSELMYQMALVAARASRAP